MYRRKSLILKIYKKVQRSKDTAFVLADFYTYCTDNDQILRALRKLVADKVLIRIGKGAYAKAKLSALTNDYVVSGGIIQAGRQALQKLGIKIFLTQAEKDYNNGISTQVPTGRVVGVNKRVNRTISFRDTKLTYERIYCGQRGGRIISLCKPDGQAVIAKMGTAGFCGGSGPIQKGPKV